MAMDNTVSPALTCTHNTYHQISEGEVVIDVTQEVKTDATQEVMVTIIIICINRVIKTLLPGL